MVNTPHITLDDEMESLSAQIAQMGGLAEEQVANALSAISRRDSALASKTVEKDDQINLLQQEVDAAAVQTLALRQPMGRDLREIMGPIKIASDLERIGDLAKNVAKRALVLNRQEPVSLTKGLVRMGRQSLVQLKDVLDAYVTRDVAAAMNVWAQDEDIDELYNSLLREFLTYMMEDPRTIGLCTHLLFIAKNLERIGDHATKIAETIYFIQEGQYLAESRPKGAPEDFAGVHPSPDAEDQNG